MKFGKISILIKNLQKSFNKKKALNDISIHFEEKLMHGIIGPEGAGKTTLLRLLIGLLKEDKGEIIYKNNQETLDFEQVREHIAYMPEKQCLYADLSIAEHLDFFRSMYLIPDDIYKKRVKKLLHITRLEKFTNRAAGKLSGGMYKKLGLICALLRSPSVMILDEPTNGVDPISRREFWELLYNFMDEEILILVSTSYMDEAERCSKVHFIEDGNLIASGEPQKLLLENSVKNFNELFLKESENKGILNGK